MVLTYKDESFFIVILFSHYFLPWYRDNILFHGIVYSYLKQAKKRGERYKRNIQTHKSKTNLQRHGINRKIAKDKQQHTKHNIEKHFFSLVKNLFSTNYWLKINCNVKFSCFLLNFLIVTSWKKATMSDDVKSKVHNFPQTFKKEG